MTDPITRLEEAAEGSRELDVLMSGERVSAKNINRLQPGDLVRRVNLVRAVKAVVGRYTLRLVDEDRFWDVRSPLQPVIFEASAPTTRTSHD